MARILLVAALVGAALFVYNRVYQPGAMREAYHHRAHSRESYPSGRDDEYRNAEHAGHREHDERREHAPASCGAFGVTCQARYFHSWAPPHDGSCHTRTSHDDPLPDPRCTPGGIDPTVSVAVLRNPEWRTACVRNCMTSEQEKHVTYQWYGLRVPHKNSGKHQVCELDHLVPLELGGADGLGNIWPECGPNSTQLDNRYFKIKDRVENYLAEQVKLGAISLETAQHGIAQDWTQYLPAANRWCTSSGRC